MHKNIQGRWFWNGDYYGHIEGYYFENKSDALLFKMIWHIDRHNPQMPLICSGKRSVP